MESQSKSVFFFKVLAGNQLKSDFDFFDFLL